MPMGTMARLGGRPALAPTPVNSLFLAPRHLGQSQRRGPGLDSHVGLGGHGDLVPRVEGGGALSHDLGHGGCEDHVPCRQEECCHTVMSIEGLLVSETGLLVSQGPGESRSYGSLYDEDVLLAIAICGRQDMRQLVSRSAMEDLLNFAVARTHLLKMITPELQAIQTLYANQSVSIAVPTCRAEPIIAVTASATTDNTTRSRTWGSCRPRRWTSGGTARTRCRRPGEGRWLWGQEERIPVGGHRPRASSPPRPSPAGFPLLQTWWRRCARWSTQRVESSRW